MSDKHQGEYITIGKFYIEWNQDGNLYIEIGNGDGAGEGGEFSEAKLEKLIADFYNKEF